MSIRVSHIGLCVNDLERSLRFYCDGLGFTRAEGYDLDETMLDGLDRALEVSGPVKLRSQMITNGDLKIELLHFTEPVATGAASAHRNQLGFTHLSIFVDDVDVTAARLAELGGEVLLGTPRNSATRSCSSRIPTVPGSSSWRRPRPRPDRSGATDPSARVSQAAALSKVISMRPRPLRLARYKA